MSRKISQNEKIVLRNAEVFYNLLKELNKSVNYMFVGFFANLVHNHFRGAAYFEIAVEQKSYNMFCIIMKEHGFNYIERENIKEFFTDELLIKVIISSDTKDFDSKLLVELKAFEKQYILWLPSLEVHKQYLNKNNGFFGKEDIKILEKEDLKDNSNRRGFLFELYFYAMYMNIKHNHKEGSYSCPLCNQK